MRLSLALVASVLAGGHAHELRGPRATAPGDNGAHVGAGSATGVAAEAMASARAEEQRPPNSDVVRDETDQYLAASNIEAVPQPRDEERRLNEMLARIMGSLGHSGLPPMGQVETAVSTVAAEDGEDERAEETEEMGATATTGTGATGTGATGTDATGTDATGTDATGIDATGATGGATGGSDSIDADANEDEHVDETSPKPEYKLSNHVNALPAPLFTGAPAGPTLPDADGALQKVSFQLLFEGIGRIRAGNIQKLKQSVAAFCGVDPSSVKIESIRPVLDPALARKKRAKRFRRRLLNALQDNLEGVVAARVTISVETTEANSVGKAINSLSGGQRNEAVQSMLDLFTA